MKLLIAKHVWWKACHVLQGLKHCPGRGLWSVWLQAGMHSLVQLVTAPNSSFTQTEIFRAFVAMEGFSSPLLRFTHLGPFSKDQLRRTINFCTCFTSWQFGFLAGAIRVFQETSICQQLLAGHSAGLNPSSTGTWTLRRGRIKYSIYTCMDTCALDNDIYFQWKIKQHGKFIC